jgi:hypothetical protein
VSGEGLFFRLELILRNMRVCGPIAFGSCLFPFPIGFWCNSIHCQVGIVTRHQHFSSEQEPSNSIIRGLVRATVPAPNAPKAFICAPQFIPWPPCGPPPAAVRWGCSIRLYHSESYVRLQRLVKVTQESVKEPRKWNKTPQTTTLTQKNAFGMKMHQMHQIW